MPTNHGFNHGFRVVQNGFRPSTVLFTPSAGGFGAEVEGARLHGDSSRGRPRGLPGDGGGSLRKNMGATWRRLFEGFATNRGPSNMVVLLGFPLKSIPKGAPSEQVEQWRDLGPPGPEPLERLRPRSRRWDTGFGQEGTLQRGSGIEVDRQVSDEGFVIARPSWRPDVLPSKVWATGGN